jgi:EpsI family protein
MTPRILILIFCFGAASAYIAKASQMEPTLAREPFSHLPMQIGNWKGQDVGLDERVLNVLGVDDYVSRVYAANSMSIGLYAGFYKSQRQGATIHSPLNCLPGAGWNPVDRTRVNISVPTEGSAVNSPILVNRILIEKGTDRQIAFYWYQAHGRVVASEYWGKIYTVLDAMRMNRTDGAMVRVIVPVAGTSPAAEQTAQKAGIDFVQSVFPLLSRYLPE